MIIPAAPGILCAQGDATTKMSHELSASFIHVLTTITMDKIREEYKSLRDRCESTMKEALDEDDPPLAVAYSAALRYKGQALELGIELSEEDLAQPMEIFEQIAKTKFDAIHQQQFSYTLENFALELTRLTVSAVDACPDLEIPLVPTADSETPPESAILEHKSIVVGGNEHQATFWDRAAITKKGHKVQGPAVIVEMDSNTLVAPGFEATVDAVGNLCISPMPGNTLLPSFKSKFESTVSDKTPEQRVAEAKKTVEDIPVIPTLISSSLASIRAEMDTLMLRCSMSPAIREQQDEFNVITNAEGKMLVGQFGSFIGQFMKIWTHKMNKKEVDEIEEGDVFITNDVYEVEGAVSHLNDVIVLLPIYYEHQLVGWAANFGHMTDVQGQVPGSMSINAQTIFDDGLQIPTMKLFERGKMNKSIVELMCRNSRQPEWLRSDLLALISACRTAATRVCELCTRFGPEVYAAATDVLLQRTRTAVSQIIEEHMTDELSTFTDFVDDDGHGKGPFALKCTLSKPAKNRLKFDWHGTSPQASSSINYYLSETVSYVEGLDKKQHCGSSCSLVHPDVQNVRRLLPPRRLLALYDPQRRIPRLGRCGNPPGFTPQTSTTRSSLMQDAFPRSNHGHHASALRPKERRLHDRRRLQRFPSLLLLGLQAHRRMVSTLPNRLRRRPRTSQRRRTRLPLSLPRHQKRPHGIHRTQFPRPPRSQRSRRRLRRSRFPPWRKRSTHQIPFPLRRRIQPA